MDEKRVTVYMMIGLPGAGKDTWIKNHLPDIPFVCTDNIRYELGFSDGPDVKTGNDISQEKIVRFTYLKQILGYVENGQDVIINNINLLKENRDEMKKLLASYNVKWTYVVVEAPDLKTVIKRRVGQIAPGVLQMWERKYQPPTPDEYDEIIYDKQKKDEN